MGNQNTKAEEANKGLEAAEGQNPPPPPGNDPAKGKTPTPDPEKDKAKEKDKQPPPPKVEEPKRVRSIFEGTLGPLLLKKGDETEDPAYVDLLKVKGQKKVVEVK